jgi:hypothetical protein
MHKAQLEQIKALAKAATPGPWRHTSVRDIGFSRAHHHYYVMPAKPTASVIAFTGEEGDPQGLLDAKFIAAVCPATVLQMIARIEQLGPALNPSIAIAAKVAAQ